MMRRCLILLTLLAGVCFPARADGELEKLVRDVLTLRQSGSDEVVKASLAEDYRWTLMTEVGLWQEGECTFEDDYEVFSLNDFAVDIAEQRVGETRSAGLFCNGLDKQYQHSFIEKSLRAGARIHYLLPERSGAQEVVLVPLHPDAAWQVSLVSGGQDVPATRTEDGCFRFVCPAGEDGLLHLYVENDGPGAQSLVILNYNSRQ
ncbi:MAG: hypothetical protein II171_05405 [Bacteroidales bacterium]|nr:hypothetical protein [Bacteroidales bacterium]